MLDVDNAPPFLLRRGLVDVDVILAGELAIRSAARRNRNLVVFGSGGSGYLIKQPDDPADGGVATLRAEAAFYDACRRGMVPAEVARLAPRLADFDPEGVVLVLDLIPGAAPLWSLDWTGADPDLPAEVGRPLGQALGTAHRALHHPGPADADPVLATLDRTVPWILRAQRPEPSLLATLSRANLQTLRILQEQPGLADGLDRLAGLWRVETVIHGDVKADNILFRPASPGPPPAPARAWLVDWEMIQLGDPAWDLAGALHLLLHGWITSMPLFPGATPESLAAQARRPLPVLQSAARALWRSYRSAAEIPADRAEEFLGRAVAYSGALLIQAAYELAFDVHRLPDPAILRLQVGSNILDDPAAGRLHLYGLAR